jgi:signal transduction histidine kinase
MSKVLQQKLQKRLPDEAARAGEIVQLISQAIDETRQLSRGLHPVALDENGLMSALQALATTTQELFGISCTFRCDEPVLVGDASTAVHLYRIAQEALTNAMRHAQAKRILIELRADEDRAILSIDNDGRPFPKRPPKGTGMGLQVMRYRAEGIGGILEIHGGPNGGTRVTCTFDAKRTRGREAKQDAAKDRNQH